MKMEAAELRTPAGLNFTTISYLKLRRRLDFQAELWLVQSSIQESSEFAVMQSHGCLYLGKERSLALRLN